MREATGSQISARLLEVIAHADFEVLPELYRFGPPTVRRDAAGGRGRIRTGWRRLEPTRPRRPAATRTRCKSIV